MSDEIDKKQREEILRAYKLPRRFVRGYKFGKSYIFHFRKFMREYIEKKNRAKPKSDGVDR